MNPSIKRVHLFWRILVNKKSVLVRPEVESKIDALLSKMTLAEKVGQMNQYNGVYDATGPMAEAYDPNEKFEKIASGKVGSMLNVLGTKDTYEAQKIAVEESRLGIPLIFGYDVIHGYKTMLPIPVADTSSWDLEVIKKGARVAATEAAAAGVHWTFAPMMDVTRDARWGRIMEGSGEDPFLSSKVAVARIEGIQGDDLSDLDTIAATAKHFTGYGFVIAGLDYNNVEINRNTLYNMVFPPFKASIEAGVATVMNSFNDIDGIPVTGNEFLQKNLLKNDWAFDGFIISDWNTIGEMVAHGYAKDLEDASEKAAKAGTDMDMQSRGYEMYLENLILSGKVDESLIDESVRRILRIKFLLGIFDDPYRYCNPEREKKVMLSDQHKAIARDSAKHSIVLLKNDSNILPLSKNLKSIAVIGALANDKDTPLGSWRGKAIKNSAVSLLEGIQSSVSKSTSVKFAKGYTLASGEREFIKELNFENVNDTSGFKEAINLAKVSETVIMAVGEECFQSGESRSQTNIGLKGTQLELLKEIKKVNKNIVIILMNGRPIAESWMYENLPAILETWHLGSEAGHGIADVVFGDYNPSGKLPISIPRNLGQVPIYYNHNQTGRPVEFPADPDVVFWTHYSDSERTPQFPFGYGLSYSTFKYSDFNISSSKMKMDGQIEVKITVTNTSSVVGEEVVQLYINDKYSSTIRPVKELKNFEKITLKAGESKNLTFIINAEALAFYGADLVFKAEPGEFEVMVGGNSVDLLVEEFELI